MVGSEAEEPEEEEEKSNDRSLLLLGQFGGFQQKEIYSYTFTFDTVTPSGGQATQPQEMIDFYSKRLLLMQK